MRAGLVVDATWTRLEALAATTRSPASMESIIGIALLIVFIYLAIKVVGFALKIAFVVAILAVAYWLVAPLAGLPQPWG